MKYTNLVTALVLMGGLRRIIKCLLSANQCVEIVSNDLLSINFFRQLLFRLKCLSHSNQKI